MILGLNNYWTVEKCFVIPNDNKELSTSIEVESVFFKEVDNFTRASHTFNFHLHERLSIFIIFESCSSLPSSDRRPRPVNKDALLNEHQPKATFLTPSLCKSNLMNIFHSNKNHGIPVVNISSIPLIWHACCDLSTSTLTLRCKARIAPSRSEEPPRCSE